MKPSLILVLVATLLISTQTTASTLEQKIEGLHSVADTYPPKLKTQEDLNAAKDLWSKTVGILENRVKTAPNDAKNHYQLGDVYRIGHNLDINGAWDKADRHLKRAMTLDPKDPQIYVTLGRHYVNTHPKHAETAFKLFEKALKVAGDPKKVPQAVLGMGMASHMRGDSKAALEYLDVYLKIVPSDEGAKKLRGAVAQAAKR